MEFCEVVVAGHICLDIHPTLSDCSGAAFDQVFLPGRLIKTGLISFSTGGPVSNTGLALHRLGNSTRLVGKVGNDLFGQVILDLIKVKNAMYTIILFGCDKFSQKISVCSYGLP